MSAVFHFLIQVIAPWMKPFFMKLQTMNLQRTFLTVSEVPFMLIFYIKLCSDLSCSCNQEPLFCSSGSKMFSGFFWKE